MKRGQKLRIVKEDRDHPYPIGAIVFFVEAHTAENLVWVQNEEDGLCLLRSEEYEKT